MATRYEQTAQDYEPSGLGRKICLIGGTALASVAITGGAAMGYWAYNDLRQGVDGSVFDIHHAETHAFQAPGSVIEITVDPANFDLQAQTYSVEFSA